MANFGSTLAVMLILVIMTAIAVYLFLQHKKGNNAPANTMSLQQLQTIVYDEIQDICELALVKKEFTSVVAIDLDKKIPLLDVHIPGTSRKFLMDYSGTIKIGFDMNKVQVLREESFGNKLKIYLPQCKILELYADIGSFKIRHQDAGIFSENIKIEEQNEWVTADVAEQGRQAVQEGLLKRADDNARQLLLNRISNRGLNNIDIEIISVNEDTTQLLNSPQRLLR